MEVETSSRPLHIVIGAGPGGIFCAHELSLYGDVILLEKGTFSNDSITKTPQKWGTSFSSGPQTEFRETVPQSRLYSRKILYPTGIGLGGSTNINAMIFSGGHPAVFDHNWPVEWNSTTMTRLFQKVVDLVHPRRVSATPPIAEVINSVSDLSKERIDDSKEFWTTDPSQSSYLTTIDDLSLRISLYKQILEPLMDAHVQLYSNIEVKFILLQKNPLNLNSRPYTAVGVVAARTVCGSSDEYHLFTPKHGGEIVLSSGALSSPQLLRQSIILPENFSLENLHPKSDMLDLLRSSSSNDVFHIPEIGSSLLDHTILPFICLGNWRVPIDQLFSSFPFFQKKEFPITFESPPNSVHGWIFLNGSGEIYNPHESYVPPRIQLVLIDGRILCGSMFAEMLLPRFNATWYESSVRPFLFNVIQYLVSFSVIQFLLSNVFAVLICHVQPSQQGKLNQGNPQFGTHEEDIALSWKAYHTLKTIFSRAKSPTSSPFYYLELLPGPIFFYCATYSVFKVFYRYFLGTYFHYCGTNAMSSTDGTSPNGVVDVHLKVHQVEKLRVADASVFPSIPSAPIAATVMAVGIAAGEFINTDLQSEIDTKNERRN